MSDSKRWKPYSKKEWKEVRAEVLKFDHYECQRCAGNYMPDPNRPRKHTRAVLVHHHFHLTEYPQWKYSIYVNDHGKKVRNLVSLCNECHEVIHKEDRHFHSQEKKDDEFTTPERWD